MLLQIARFLNSSLGFKITDKNLRRAGMDYWKSLTVHDMKIGLHLPVLLHAPKISTYLRHMLQNLFGMLIFKGDGLLFGNEGGGAPTQVRLGRGESPNNSKVFS